MKYLDHLEGTTPIDLDEAKGLLITHITTRGDLDRWEQDNIIEAITWLDKTRPTDILNEQFIKKLHLRMFCNVWEWAGKFRKSDKNIGGPWYQVPMSLKNLCDNTNLRIKLHKESFDEIAVNFHHKLVVIHPFPNGNGRHSRLMTDLLLENILGSSRFTWGSKHLSKSSEVRAQYIAALRTADKHDFGPLLEFVRA